AVAVRAEGRRAVDAAEGRHHLAGAGGDLLDVDGGVAALEADIGQAAAVRAPGRRQQRLARAHHRLRVVAVGVGDHQRVLDVVADAAGGDVGDAGPEGAAHAEDLLVDLVGDLVGDVAHAARPAGQGQAEQALLPGHVPQLVFDAVAAVGGVEHAADNDEVLLEHAPGRELDLAAADRLLD